jgi:hypothetical protein
MYFFILLVVASFLNECKFGYSITCGLRTLYGIVVGLTVLFIVVFVIAYCVVHNTESDVRNLVSADFSPSNQFPQYFQSLIDSHPCLNVSVYERFSAKDHFVCGDCENCTAYVIRCTHHSIDVTPNKSPTISLETYAFNVNVKANWEESFILTVADFAGNLENSHPSRFDSS